ncbi:HipA domain-containing protein [Pararobbsia silviterrae]|uniref:Type II toxin-antitoxin system HipA family toxin n=1 Tax=Pararobbsia silviterrae TaxID=1792498 RepID=A0A494XNJ7_9BURK|nr:HipA domain-containing protein [Pararobbsia silviterrae]RKP49689.1 type II toxin-antitoxin system HipA family toxin [Pararobbsia silviterrae]
MTSSLSITSQSAPVGRLTHDAREARYAFDYDRAWSSNTASFPLSPHVPLNGPAPSSSTVQRFIENLLPEGRALDVAASMNQISKDNTFGLIRVLGKEPVGALSFLPVDAQPDGALVGPSPDDMAPIRRELTHEELSERIRERDAVPFEVWDGAVRLSLAGYQDKLQVLVEGDRFYLVDGSLSSTAILKPEGRNPKAPFMVANEHFCMTFAAHLSVSVAPVAIHRIPDPVLLITRFDREIEAEPGDPQRARHVKRRHVIDGCQALDVPSGFKYERNFGGAADVRHIRDGVSFEKLFSLMPYMANPAIARTHLIRWALLQLLIGNTDAHGKNVSFFQHHHYLAPTPLYDLVSVMSYDGAFDLDMAMAYGDVFRLDEISAFALADFAHRTQTRPAFLAREMIRMAKSAPKIALELANAPVYLDGERALVRKIAEFVATQAALLLKLAAMVPQVDPALL